MWDGPKVWHDTGIRTTTTDAASFAAISFMNLNCCLICCSTRRGATEGTYQQVQIKYRGEVKAVRIQPGMLTLN